VRIHTGKREVVDGKCACITVSIGAPVASKAIPSEVLISQTVRDLVAGSGFTVRGCRRARAEGCSRALEALASDATELIRERTCAHPSIRVQGPRQDRPAGVTPADCSQPRADDADP
jgi:hypothetical protein